MTDLEVFHHVTTPYGGRLDRRIVPASGQKMFAEIIDRGDDLIAAARRVVPELPPIYLDFIHNSAINAVAFKSDGRYFIGLNSGMVFMLRWVVGRMLSDRPLFRFVGDPKDEAEQLEPLSGYSPDADEMASRAVPLTPTNAIRIAYALFLQDQAIMFFVGHEITHITHGHVDYLMAKREVDVATELEWFGQKHGEELFERQCLEMDADRRSIISRIDSLRVTYESPTYVAPPWESGLGDGPGQLLLDWWISLNILFRLFGDVRFTRSALKNSNYPPLALRRFMCEMAAYAATTRFWDNTLAGTARNVFGAGRNECELAFATMLNEEPSVEGLQQAYSQSGFEHAIRLEDYWNNTMVERLRPFSYDF
jgi:hypothetical protein